MRGLLGSWFDEELDLLQSTTDPYPTSLLVKDTPIERFGLTVQRFPGRLDVLSTHVPTVEMVPGSTGGVYAQLPNAAVTEFTLEGTFLDVTSETRHQLLNALTLRFRGLLEFVWPDAPYKMLRGRAGPIRVTPLTANQDRELVRRRPELRVTIPIVCGDSARYWRHPKQLAFSQVPQAIDLGSLPSGGEFLICGPYSGALKIYALHRSGATIDTLAFTSALNLANDKEHVRVRLDSPHAIVHVSATGVQTWQPTWRDVANSSRWWKLSPQDGPSLMTSADVQVVYRYHKVEAA